MSKILEKIFFEKRDFKDTKGLDTWKEEACPLRSAGL